MILAEIATWQVPKTLLSLSAKVRRDLTREGSPFLGLGPEDGRFHD